MARASFSRTQSNSSAVASRESQIGSPNITTALANGLGNKYRSQVRTNHRPRADDDDHGAVDQVDVAAMSDDETLLRVDEALAKFAAEDPVKAELVKLRFFVGLTIPEAAAAMGMSESTAKRAWAYARAWLYAELNQSD